MPDQPITTADLTSGTIEGIVNKLARAIYCSRWKDTGSITELHDLLIDFAHEIKREALEP